jgi:serine/threonine protein kinase
LNEGYELNESAQYISKIYKKEFIARSYFLTEEKADWLARYSLRQYLGQGGMGVAYLAHDKNNNNALCVLKQLTVKDITPEEQEDTTRFFMREVEMLRHLRHPGIVKLFDHHITPGRDYFLVMDYVPGNNLSEIIKSWGAFSAEAAVEIGIQCCEILEYLHEHDPPIIYRDLKPGNLMLTPAGQIVFIDFGIARSILPQQAATRVVTTGYSPPEQYAGQPEPRSDLYALGATLGHLVTGVRPKPLAVSTPAQLKQDLLPSLDNLIRRLTAHETLDRPVSASSVRNELYRIYHEIHPEFIIPPEAQILSASPNINTTQVNHNEEQSSLWQGIKRALLLFRP